MKYIKILWFIITMIFLYIISLPFRLLVEIVNHYEDFSEWVKEDWEKIK